MKIDFNIKKENLETNSEKFKALGNPIRLRILLLLDEGSMPLDEIHLKLKKEDFFLYRESTYKALEKLVENGFVGKGYNSKTKKMVYSVIRDFLEN